MSDIINSFFEVGAALAILAHCRATIISESAKGVSFLATAFFFLWGVWNLYYYPSLDQYVSFVAGVGVMLANLLWLILLIKYKD